PAPTPRAKHEPANSRSPRRLAPSAVAARRWVLSAAPPQRCRAPVAKFYPSLPGSPPRAREYGPLPADKKKETFRQRAKDWSRPDNALQTPSADAAGAFSVLSLVAV